MAKNKDRYLFVSSQGIGNQIEEWSILWWLLEQEKKQIDIYYYFWPAEEQNEERLTFIKKIAERYKCGLTWGSDLTVKKPEQYTGQLVSVWAEPVKDVPIAARADRPYVNEVARNTSMIWDMGSDEKLEDVEAACTPIDWVAITGDTDCDIKEYGIVFCNGGLLTRHFLKKRYKRYREVAEIIAAEWGDTYEMASVGMPGDEVEGTTDLTHLTLEETFNTICRARVFVGNDSGLYHFAAAVGIPTVAVFTASNVKKSHNKNFHRSATVVTADDLRCRPCMKDSWEYSVRWTRCQQWRCASFSPQKVARAILEKL